MGVNVHLSSNLPVYLGVGLMAYSSSGIWGAGLALVLLRVLSVVVLVLADTVISHHSGKGK